MSYRIGKVSRMVGLTSQTLREYEKLGLLDAEKDEHNGYRYFDPIMVCKAVAIRYLRNLGLTLDETRETLNRPDIPYEQYLSMLEGVLARQKAALDYHQLVYDRVKEQVEATASLHETVGVCTLQKNLKFYCIDYLRGEEQLLFEPEALELLNSWIDRALFTCNYSPIPQEAFSGSQEQPVLWGLIVPERDALRLGLPLDPPVFLRSAPLWLCARLPHSVTNIPSYEELSCMREFMQAHALTFDGEPFLIGNCAFWENGEQRAYNTVYVPVRRQKP